MGSLFLCKKAIIPKIMVNPFKNINDFDIIYDVCAGKSVMRFVFCTPG